MEVNCDFKFGKNELLANEELVEKNLAELLRLGLDKKDDTKADNLGMDKKEDTKADNAVVLKLKQELDSLKTTSTSSQKGLEEAMAKLEQKFESGMKYLPKLVRSDRHKVIHANTKTLVSAPAAFWKTACGWLYYNSIYEFDEGELEKVSCEKCKAALNMKDKGAAIHSSKAK